MSLVEKIGKENLVIVGSLLALGTISTLIPFYVSSQIKKEWARLAYVLREESPMFSLYGYDDNRDGSVDRINVLRLAPVGIQVLVLQETYDRNNPLFFQYQQKFSTASPLRTP